MRNPIASESSAYHFLLLTVVAFAVIAIASALGGPVVAFVVWVAVSLVAIAIYAIPASRVHVPHRTRLH